MTATASRPRRRAAVPARIERTEALVLRIHPYSRTSHVVAWLAADGRRIATSVKGATRAKSDFLGQYDLFQTCELLYYAAEHDGVHVAKECETLRRRDRLRDNWRAEHAASWFAALADIAARSDAPSPALFPLLSETLDLLDAADGAPPPAVFARFEAKLLDAAGWRPNFSGAERAGSAVRFNLAEGSLAAPGETSDPVVPLPREAVELFDALLASPSVGPGSTFARSTPAATDALLRFLGLFLRQHLPDAPLEGRALALASMRGFPL